MSKYAEDVRKILDDVILYEDYVDDTNLIEEGILDSLMVVYLVSQLEEKYHIKIEGHFIVPEHFSSINRIAGFLKRLENGPQSELQTEFDGR